MALSKIPVLQAGAPVPARVVIENVRPQVDCGRFPVKRTVGETVTVTADIFADGHDLLSAVLRYQAGDGEWREIPMRDSGNDCWTATFVIERFATHRYTVEAWVDKFKSWRRDLRKRLDAGQDVSVDLLVGAELVEAAAARASERDARRLRDFAADMRDDKRVPRERGVEATAEELALLMARYPDRAHAAHYERELSVSVDRERARFSSWYEMFPRSCSDDPARHGTFADCEKRLDYIAAMGFDVLYLPPIHPIGRTNRKGKNNNPTANPGEVGSPWAIGADEGGHKAIHPQLGTLEDLKRLRAKAAERGIELALDIAFQATPDHPYPKEHPEWFTRRPDGSIQYAENPPKKYQDIYPINFESADWPALWEELKSVVEYWADQGIRIFRVDNPHTKAFAFWEWMIAEVRKKYSDAIFLSEAFTRPRVMYRLAKLGFTQSYTYFTWRNTKRDFVEYLTELTQTDVREFFRPNFWPNTPDILPEHLQYGGRAAFMQRLMMAATMSSNYGIYGPAFELMENRPLAPGKEEYLDSEKYEIRRWDLGRADNLNSFIARINQIRRENEALQYTNNLLFHSIDNDQLLAFSKSNADGGNIVLVIVNLNVHQTHSGWVTLQLDKLGIAPEQQFQVHDLLTGARYFWQGARNFVKLDPQVLPAHILRIRRRVRTEADFDYFM